LSIAVLTEYSVTQHRSTNPQHADQIKRQSNYYRLPENGGDVCNPRSNNECSRDIETIPHIDMQLLRGMTNTTR